MSSGNTSGLPVRMEWYSEYESVPVGEADTLHLLIRIIPPESLAVRQRHPLNICIVVDQSSSMQGRTMKRVKQAAKVLISSLKPTDRISLAAFDHEARTIIKPVYIEHKSELFAAIDALKATGGWTSLSGGLKRGIELLSCEPGQDDYKRIILLTDGQANRGITSRDGLCQIALDARRNHDISTTTVGFGLDFNEDLLHAIALSGAGEYYYVQHVDQAPAVFAEELSSLQSLALRRVSVTVEASGNVKSFQQVTRHFESSHANRSALIEVGNIRVGELRDILLAFDLRKFPREQRVNLGRVHLAYEPIQGVPGEPRTASLDLKTRAVTRSSTKRQPRRIVAQAVLLQQSAQVRRLAVRDTDEGNRTFAIRRLNDFADFLSMLPKEMKNEQLEAEIIALRGHAERLDTAGSPEHLNTLRKYLTSDTTLLATGNYTQLMTLRMRRDELLERINEKQAAIEVNGTDSMRFSRASFLDEDETRSNLNDSDETV